MAIAAQTNAKQWDLLRHLNITGKDLYDLLTRPTDLTLTGPAFDTKMTALLAALKAAGYTTPA